MRALIWHTKQDIICDPLTDRRIEQRLADIIRVGSCANHGSDSHRFLDFIPAMLPGDIMDQEVMGEVGEGVIGRSKKRSAEAWGATRLSVRTPPRMQASLAFARAVT